MHRTTTTATLLLSVAVSALSGCVTVQQRPSVSGPQTAPSRPSAPRPDGSAEPRDVQAPAREALELISPQRTPGAAARAHAPGGPAEDRSHPPAHFPAPHPPLPAPRNRHAPPPPRIDLPKLPPQAARRKADICALGRKYGDWKPGSPEAVICGQAYGR
ncbi:hypothetical protein ABZT08_26900 [Streptomyces sp. NPDC005526]|uniref:hypothetical protein n=1 Tax=Streptomyces sp. NPDC005526 TaxID=3156885 RepID=UPI0033B33058